MCYIGVFKDITLICKRVKVGGLNNVVAVATHGVEALLVGGDEQQIGLLARRFSFSLNSVYVSHSLSP